MRSVRLGDILNVQSGFAFKTEFFSDSDGIPLIRIRDLPNGSTDTNYCGEFREEFIVEQGDYLIGMDGNFRCYCWQGSRALLNQRVCRLQNFNSEANPEYIFYGIQKKLREIEDNTPFATVKHISAKQILNIELPLPKYNEQRRIVDILARAESIVRLRREALKKTQEIIPALFLDMFGDPATNLKGFEIWRLADIGTLDRGKSKHRPRDAAELYGGPYPFIQTGEVANSGGVITKWTKTYSEAGLAQSRLWPKGTLCITIAANIAETGVLDFDACFPDSVVGFIPGKTALTGYVQMWLDFLQPTLEALAPQLAQKNINLAILRELPIPLPPLDMQVEYVRRVEQIRSIQSQATRALATAEVTVQSLLHRAFAGEL